MIPKHLRHLTTDVGIFITSSNTSLYKTPIKSLCYAMLCHTVPYHTIPYHTFHKYAQYYTISFINLRNNYNISFILRYKSMVSVSPSVFSSHHFPLCIRTLGTITLQMLADSPYFNFSKWIHSELNFCSSKFGTTKQH